MQLHCNVYKYCHNLVSLCVYADYESNQEYACADVCAASTAKAAFYQTVTLSKQPGTLTKDDNDCGKVIIN